MGENAAPVESLRPGTSAKKGRARPGLLVCVRPVLYTPTGVPSSLRWSRAAAATMAARQRANLRLPPEVNRALYVRNLPFKITPEEMYDIFGKYGAIRQIRMGNASDTRGTAFVVYEDIYDAKNAVDHLSGFNVCGRYLVVLYYQQTKMQKRLDTEREAKELAEMRARLGIDTGDAGMDLAGQR